ncbi:MAG: Gfo/Idh/MocA family oxidoreductase [Armatimonadetes bacterium]|nr:Gfo/Idh/MocA family oxidoreductase [Armatimonadota bacterium]
MSDATFGFAVVGLGMGQTHCKDINDARGARLVAVCDLVPERVQRMVDRYGCRGTAEFAEILASPDIDVVSIATPSGVHSDMTVAALRAGKHVLCEKPPDVSVAKVDAMIAAQRETGKKLEIVFQSRFEPFYRRVRQTIADGRLGKLIGAHASVHWYRTQEYFASPGMWKGTWALDGGGSLSNQGIHTVDLLQWMLGPVVEVYGKFGVYAHDIESEDKTAAVLAFANGAIGTLTTTTGAYPGSDNHQFIHGEKGTIEYQGGLKVWRIRADSREAEAEEERQMLALYGPKEKRDVTISSDPFAMSSRGHMAQVEDLVRAIREDGEPTVTAEGTRHTVEIMNAIYESGRTGKPVRLGG